MVRGFQSQLSQPEEATAWAAGPWRRLLAELRLSPSDADDWLPQRINLVAVRRAAAANQLRRVPLLAVLLHSLVPTSDRSYQATFCDPTGERQRAGVARATRLSLRDQLGAHFGKD